MMHRALFQVIAIGQSRRDAVMRSKRMRRNEELRPSAGAAPPPAAADVPAAVRSAVEALALLHDIGSSEHLEGLRRVRRLLSMGARSM